MYEDYSDVQEKEPKEEEYDSSSLPALLFKARTILGAKKHLKTINYQLEKLLEQEWEDHKLSQPPAVISPEAALLTLFTLQTSDLKTSVAYSSEFIIILSFKLNYASSTVVVSEAM